MTGRSRDWWQGRIDMLADKVREADSDLAHALFMELSYEPRLLPHLREEHAASDLATTTYRRALAELRVMCDAAAHHGFPAMSPSGPALPD